jgi:hypothetical protein
MVHDIPASADSQVGTCNPLSRSLNPPSPADAFREQFMFSVSFLLDIYGNPTTLGCQMDYRARRVCKQAKGVFPRDQNSLAGGSRNG